MKAVPDYKCHHTLTCTAEYCDYTVTEDCTNENNLCATCGFEFPTWKMFYYTTQEWTLNGKTEIGYRTHYAHEETVIKKHPFEDEEPIRTVQPGEEFCVLGWTFYDKNGVNYCLLNDGTYIRNGYTNKDQVSNVLEWFPQGKVGVVTYVIKNDKWLPLVYTIYDSMEDAMKDTMPCSFEELKKIWKYKPGNSSTIYQWYPYDYSDQSKGTHVSTINENDKYPYSYERYDQYEETDSGSFRTVYRLWYVYIYYRK